MIDNRVKKHLSKLIEIYSNDIKKYAVEEFYGAGSLIKIKDINYITNGKYFAVEAVVILKGTITECVMDKSLALILIQDSFVYFFPNESVAVHVEWDV